MQDNEGSNDRACHVVDHGNGDETVHPEHLSWGKIRPGEHQPRQYQQWHEQASYVALLCLGKSDFEAIDAFRADAYFHTALGLGQVPSAATLRQRLDAHAAGFKDAVIAAGIEFLRRCKAPITPLANGLVALDADVTPMNNAKTKKEGVSLTYKGEDGFAPMAAYLGQEGYCLELELREGRQHCQKGTPALLTRVLERARRLTSAPLLVRLDSGNDALENIATISAHEEQDPQAAPVHYDPVESAPLGRMALNWLKPRDRRGEYASPGQARGPVPGARNPHP